jgi:hypothetical protein
MRRLRVDRGMSGPYWWPGPPSDKVEEEYKKFQCCLPQLIDGEAMLGDLDGKWVIFKDGWVYGLATYETQMDAISFGRQMFRDEPEAIWIVVQVDLEAHKISPLHLLGDALSQLEFEEAKDD